MHLTFIVSLIEIAQQRIQWRLLVRNNHERAWFYDACPYLSLCYFSLNVQTALGAHAKMRTYTQVHGGRKYKEGGYECTEFQSSQFILAHLQWHEVKHKRWAVWRKGGGWKRWEGGNRRSGFAPVVSEGSERTRPGDGGEMEKGVASGL